MTTAAELSFYTPITRAFPCPRQPLDEIANPADASYIPRPEWYFLSLFQMLKYFPGRLEPIATMVIPGAIVAFLMLLPFVDRGGGRHPFRAPRRMLTATLLAIGLAIVALTGLGFADLPEGKDPDDWGLLPIAGLHITRDPASACTRRHEAGGPAAPLAITRLTKDEEWLLSHMADPVAIAPGVRSEQDPAPKPVMSRFRAQAVVAFLRREHAGGRAPNVSAGDKLAALTYADTCVVCHRISGEGGTLGPDLTHVATRRDEASIKAVIKDAPRVFGETAMPVFKTKLSAEQIDALANYFARRRGS